MSSPSYIFKGECAGGYTNFDCAVLHHNGVDYYIPMPYSVAEAMARKFGAYEHGSKLHFISPTAVDRFVVATLIRMGSSMNTDKTVELVSRIDPTYLAAVATAYLELMYHCQRVCPRSKYFACDRAYKRFYGVVKHLIYALAELAGGDVYHRFGVFVMPHELEGR